MPKVTIYTTQLCPYCTMAKRLLASKGVKYEEIAVDRDSARREEMMQRAGGRRTVPQIFIGELHVGGCDDLHALDSDGELDPLLAA